MNRLPLLLAPAVLLFTALLSPLYGAELKARPSDGDIAFAVENQFLFDKSVTLHAVEAVVTNGAITLTGTVNNLLDKERATLLAETVRGVQSVTNNITVQVVKRADEAIRTDVVAAHPPYSDEGYYRSIQTNQMMDIVIAAKIKDALVWSPFVDADEVSVSVNGQVATLTGTVDSWAEFRAAQENAYEGGATRVENKLKVE